ncbi:MAG: Uncharacterised protein [Synechococcus sp. CC9902]|nr:MAG: Uncharacterised protein [Synechococcus sp. CC9902]
MVGNARHRHPTNGFPALLAGERELQHPRQLHGVFEEAFEEIAESVQQHPFGMGRLEFHVVAQHRRELQRIHLAVMGPGGGIVFGSTVVGSTVIARAVFKGGFFGGVLGFSGGGARVGIASRPRPGGCISPQFGIAQLASGCFRFSLDPRGFRLPEQAPLQGIVLGVGSGPWHLDQNRNRIVPSSFSAV